MNTAGPVWKASELGCVEAKGALCFLSSAYVGTGTYTTVQAALDASGSGDIVEVCPGTHEGGFTLPDSDAVTIRGMDPHRQFSVLDGGAAAPVMTVPPSGSLVLERLTITNGRGVGGAISAPYGLQRLDLIDVDISGNFGEEIVHVWGMATFPEAVTIRHSRFADNKPDWNQSVVMLWGVEEVVIEDCVFVDNSQTPVQIAWDREQGVPVPIQITRSSFIDNNGSHGAVELDDHGLPVLGTDASLVIEDLLVQGNVSRGGGAIGVSSYNASVTVSASRFDGNHSRNGNAAVEMTNFGALHISGSIFQMNEGDNGGIVGVSTAVGTSNLHAVTIADSSFISNVASSNAGAIEVVPPWRFDLLNVLFDGNSPIEVAPCPQIGDGVFTFGVDPAAGVYCQ